MSKTCLHCGTSFTSPQRAALFCTRKCKTDAGNLEAARGKQLYRLAMNWAAAGGGMGKAFSDLSWLAREFVKEDRKAGRPLPPAGPTDMSVSQSYLTRRAPKLARERRQKELN